MASVETDETEQCLRELSAARESYRDAEAAVEKHGEQTLRELGDALRRADSLLDQYADDASGTGDFQAFVTFQGEFAELTEGLPEDMPGREAFESANEIVDQRRLSPEDFERARAALDPARDSVGRLEARRTALDELDDARRQVKKRIDAVDEEITELEHVQSFADVDLSVPTDEVAEQIDSYDDAVTDAFESFRHDASARRVLNVVQETRHFPLVEFERPPSELLSYVRDSAVGEESIQTLLKYEDYSVSKLDHYVPDPATFRTRIAVHRTYLDRLSAEPLTVGWPPPEAGALRRLGDELVSVTAKFAPESVIAQARQLVVLAQRDDYDRIRTAARADTELSASERERLASGAISTELEELREDRERLRTALDEDIR